MMLPVRAQAGLALVVILAAACGRPDIDAQMARIRRWEDSRTMPADSLSHLLAHGTARVRAAAARAMGRIGDPAALVPLTQALESDRRPEVRGEAAFALGILGLPDAAPALVRHLAHESHTWALGEAALALGRLQEPPAGTADTLVPLLHHGHPHVREQVLEALALLADSTTTSALLEATFDPVASVAWRAAYALEKMPGPTQVPRLIELTQSSTSLVRRHAIRSLGRLGAAEAVPSIVEAMHGADRDWQVRVMAADALGRLGGEAAVAALAEALDDTLFHVRVTALQGLARLRHPVEYDRMRALTDDPCVDVRVAAYGALASCWGARAAEELERGVADPSDLVAGTCLATLPETGSPRAREILLAASEDAQRPAIRYRAFEGLGGLGEAAPRELLRKALDDDDWVVAATAAEQLARLGDHEAVPRLLETYTKRSGAGRNDVCWQILQSLGTLADPRAVPLLREALEQEDDVRLRLAAREALLQILPETEAARLPKERDIRADVRPVHRSPKQPPLVVRSLAQQLILETGAGDIYIDLLGDDAPQTVESFAVLAEGGFFDNLTFHRVVPNFVIQGGDPLGNGWGDPGYTLRSEWHPGRYERGTVGVAHSGKDTGGCQLFITQSPQPHLDARYTIFGRVAQGMDVVDRIQMGDRFTAQVRWSER